MQGAGEWVLLDFPGLGAAESGVRDGFLCKRELREVQTILILLDGRRPGGEGGQVIFNMMNADRPPGQDLRDSILVIVNRFDQLPIQAEGGELLLDRLVGWTDPAGQAADHLPAADPEPIPETEVLARLPVLSAMVVGARNLTRRDDRIVVFSALWALGDWNKVLPSDVPVGSPEFVASLASLLKAPPPLRLKWERLAQLLREADPRSSLARWLDDVTRDGGIGRLQKLIVEHVAQHGLRQLLDYVRAAAEDLARAVRKLPKKRPRPAGATGPTAETVRQAVDGLYDVYTALKAEYEQAAPELTIAADGRAVSLQQRVSDQVTERCLRRRLRAAGGPRPARGPGPADATLPGKTGPALRRRAGPAARGDVRPAGEGAGPPGRRQGAVEHPLLGGRPGESRGLRAFPEHLRG
jgi:hypothetical protein